MVSDDLILDHRRVSRRKKAWYYPRIATTQLGGVWDKAMADASRGELGDFLRSRRERLSPQTVGLRGGRKRRTLGLRREEVAELAGIGVD